MPHNLLKKFLANRKVSGNGGPHWLIGEKGSAFESLINCSQVLTITRDEEGDYVVELAAGDDRIKRFFALEFASDIPVLSQLRKTESDIIDKILERRGRKVLEEAEEVA